LRWLITDRQEILACSSTPLSITLQAINKERSNTIISLQSWQKYSHFEMRRLLSNSMLTNTSRLLMLIGFLSRVDNSPSTRKLIKNGIRSLMLYLPWMVIGILLYLITIMMMKINVSILQ